MFLFYSSTSARPAAFARGDLHILARALISSHGHEAIAFVRINEERARYRRNRCESELWRGVSEILEVLLDVSNASANDR